MFPWLNMIAKAFDLWLPVRMSIEYRPKCSMTSVGKMAMAFDYDVLDHTGSVNFQYVTAMAGAVNTQVFTPITMTYNATRTVLPNHKYFTDTSGDDRFASPARLLAIVDSSVEGAIGDIYVNYVIQMNDPEPYADYANLQLGVRTSATQRTNDSPLGDLPTNVVQMVQMAEHNKWAQAFLQTFDDQLQLKGDLSKAIGAFKLLTATNSKFKWRPSDYDITQGVGYAYPSDSGACLIEFYCTFIYHGILDPGQPAYFKCENNASDFHAAYGPHAVYSVSPCDGYGRPTGVPHVFISMGGEDLAPHLVEGGRHLLVLRAICIKHTEQDPFLFFPHFVNMDNDFETIPSNSVLRHANCLSLANALNPMYFNDTTNVSEPLPLADRKSVV